MSNSKKSESPSLESSIKLIRHVASAIEASSLKAMLGTTIKVDVPPASAEDSKPISRNKKKYDHL